MLTQSVLLVAAAPRGVDFGKPSVAGATECEGCGCCKVETADELCCCCRSSEVSPPRQLSGSEVETSSLERQPRKPIFGACLCGISSVPLVPGDSGNKHNIVPKATVFEFPANEGENAKPFSLTPASCGVILNPRDAQRFLCSWRL